MERIIRQAFADQIQAHCSTSDKDHSINADSSSRHCPNFNDVGVNMHIKEEPNRGENGINDNSQVTVSKPIESTFITENFNEYNSGINNIKTEVNDAFVDEDEYKININDILGKWSDLHANGSNQAETNKNLSKIMESESLIPKILTQNAIRCRRYRARKKMRMQGNCIEIPKSKSKRNKAKTKSQTKSENISKPFGYDSAANAVKIEEDHVLIHEEDIKVEIEEMEIQPVNWCCDKIEQWEVFSSRTRFENGVTEVCVEKEPDSDIFFDRSSSSGAANPSSEGHESSIKTEQSEYYICDNCKSDPQSYAVNSFTKADARFSDVNACAICKDGSIITTNCTPKDCSEINWHKCDLCDYKSKEKCKLTSHMLIHKDASEIEWLKCELCDFKSKWKGNLKTHMLNHEDPSKISWYKCDLCEHKVKVKGELKRHVTLKHKDPTEMKWHECRLCEYKSVWKWRVTNHMLARHNKSLEK
ncbi:hypothetical protein NQ315_015556 [Exocentrus adspersus]|uniref:C2H2-type domain-containing protein n=1 Tax=Exocentrus adspersus TaxID=1586481 RepID=A0AAV8V6I9_9CUCU|nr:hypothetical protein NQ315_015556 [Exocentrus adspersus]